jgi:hypothetical protein
MKQIAGHEWRKVMPAFANKFTVVAPDHLGHVIDRLKNQFWGLLTAFAFHLSGNATREKEFKFGLSSWVKPINIRH